MSPQAAIIIVAFPACLALDASIAAGQTVGAMNGAITGTVTDSTGAVLSDVTIVVSGAALMRTRATVTSEEGLYRFLALAPGEYTLVFTRNGFKAVSREGIYLGLGFTATVDVELQAASLQEEVIVERSLPLIDEHSTAIAATYDARQLANLPSARSMWGIQAATPAVYLPRFDLGASATGLVGPISAHGTSGFNRPMVEGINVSGINPTGFTLDYGAFEEVSVATAAHGPEWPWPGVHMQFLSKSGGNKYRGTIYVDYLNGEWQSFNIDAEQIRRGAQGGPGTAPREANRLSRYRDLNGDIGGYIARDTLWWYSSVRHQEVAARQLNFPVKPFQTSLTHYGGKATYQPTQDNKIIAFAQPARNHQPNLLDPFGPPGFGVGPTTAINESEQSTIDQLASGWVWKGEWNSVINDTIFFEVRVGQFGADRPQKPHGESPRFEDVGTLIVTGGNRDWQQSLRRNQVLGALSYFKDGWAGNHHLTLGGEIFRTIASEVWRRGYAGGVVHVLRNGTPIEVYLFQTPSKSENGLWIYAAHVNDSWRATDRVTLNLGVRFDRYRLFLPEQALPPGRFNPTEQSFPAVDNLIDWNVLAPRIGFTYDQTGDGNTVAKLSFGEYWLPPSSNLLNANPEQNTSWSSGQSFLRPLSVVPPRVVRLGVRLDW